MTIQEIKFNFPEEWILLGNPQFEGTKVTEGIVLLHGKDKTLLAQQGSTIRSQYKLVKFIYTGQIQRVAIFLGRFRQTITLARAEPKVISSK